MRRVAHLGCPERRGHRRAFARPRRENLLRRLAERRGARDRTRRRQRHELLTSDKGRCMAESDGAAGSRTLGANARSRPPRSVERPRLPHAHEGRCARALSSRPTRAGWGRGAACPQALRRWAPSARRRRRRRSFGCWHILVSERREAARAFGGTARGRGRSAPQPHPASAHRQVFTQGHLGRRLTSVEPHHRQATRLRGPVRDLQRDTVEIDIDECGRVGR
jgi:hypothetical protein